ncbi:MAG: QsdR family transcriptional regulator, partial [Pseudomonadota bacterium]|nr:QsdR family transcriptional regulator [Pseudomonadota bacterium]
HIVRMLRDVTFPDIVAGMTNKKVRAIRSSRSLRPFTPRSTAADAFVLARDRFVRGERIDLQEVAAELGINRVTLYRWVGTRERLIGEVLCYFADRAWEIAGDRLPDRGPEYAARHFYRFLQAIQGFEPFQRFVASDPEYALRVLTSRHSVLQEHVIGLYRVLLEEQVAAKRLNLPRDLESLAYALVRISEAYLYNDIITGREPDLDQALQVIAALLQAPWKSLRV